MKKTVSFLYPLVLILFIVPLIWSCKGTGTFEKNIPPITRLSNNPPTDTVVTTSNPLVTLSWIGDDPDGFVVAFRYRWNFRLNSASPFQYKPWTTILNIWSVAGGGANGTQNFALLTDASVPNIPAVYHYFAILQSPDVARADSLAAGDTVHVAGARVWASNPKAVQYPTHVNPSTGTFIFDSQDSLNPHTFEVLAVDNLGALGAPAKITFINPRVSAPKTRIVTSPGDTVMVINDATVSWPGVEFTYLGFDPNSRIVEYQWVVDKDQWPAGNVPWSDFSPSTTAFVTARNLPDPYATNHTFYVRARNEFGVIDTVGMYIAAHYDVNSNITGYDTIRANVAFKTLYPQFARPGTNPRIIFINNSFAYSEATNGKPSTQQVDQYYSRMLDNSGWAGKYDIFDAVDDGKSHVHIFPSRGVLSQYSIIVFAADVINCTGSIKDFAWGHLLTSDRQQIITDYLNIGGKLIVSSWALQWPLNCGAGPWSQSTIHMQDDFLDIDTVDHPGFLGATGVKGYPDVVIDSAKVAEVWPKPAAAPGRADSTWGLHFTYAGRTSGFGEIIYTYVTTPNNYIMSVNALGFPEPRYFNGAVNGSRYIGITYDVIYLGFPLYYINCPGGTDNPSATAVLRKALSDIN